VGHAFENIPTQPLAEFDHAFLMAGWAEMYFIRLAKDLEELTARLAIFREKERQKSFRHAPGQARADINKVKPQ
jgi:hypothetical protein